MHSQISTKKWTKPISQVADAIIQNWDKEEFECPIFKTKHKFSRPTEKEPKTFFSYRGYNYYIKRWTRSRWPTGTAGPEREAMFDIGLLDYNVERRSTTYKGILYFTEDRTLITKMKPL